MENVQGWLKSKHICVLDEWVQACVDWVHEEQGSSNMPGSQLCQLVYEQWIDSDLSVIATPCLPPGVKQAKKIKLNGNFVLQVNSVQDISSPAYSQLVKLTGKENENATVSATQATQSKFEPNSNRMLMLSLTDGHETIQAMEYHVVPALSPQLTPGSKILLSGEMQCRLGVILLTPGHVRVLGGEVEALKETNSREKILARAIGVPPPERLADTGQQNTEPQAPPVAPRPTAATTTNNGSNYRDTTPVATHTSNNQRNATTRTNSNIHSNSTARASANNNRNNSSWNQPSTHSSRNQPPQNQVTKREVPKPRPKQEAASQSWGQARQRSSGGGQSWGQAGQRSSGGGQSWGHQTTPADQFPEDDDGLDEFMLQELEMLERQQAQEKQPTVVEVEDNWDDEGINEEELLAMEWENSVQNKNSGHQSGAPVKPKQDGFTRPGMGNAHTVGRTNAIAPLNSTSHGFNAQPSKSNNPGVGNAPTYGRNTIAPSSRTSNSMTLNQSTSKHSGSNWSRTSNSSSSSNNTFGSEICQSGIRHGTKTSQGNATSPFGTNAVPLFKSESTTAKPVAPKYEQTSQKNTVVPQTGFGVGASGHGTNTRTENSNAWSNKVNQHSGASKVAVATRIIKDEPISQKSGGRPSAETELERQTEMDSIFGLDFVKIRRLLDAAESNESLAKRRKIEPGSSLKQPFIYLVHMKEQLVKKQTCRFDIKGFIMTLMSSLSHNPTWNVTAKINDGTMSLDVDFSDQVLAELIGFTVKEMIQMKSEMKRVNQQRAADIKNNIRQGIMKCQQALKDLSCIMTVEMNPDCIRPRVTAVRKPTIEDARQLLEILTADTAGSFNR